MKTVTAYKKADGTCPFREWRRDLPNVGDRAIIDARIDRVAEGNVGDCKSVGDEVFELRIHHGAGYRVYFAYVSDKFLVLLIGGDKSTQKADIKTAKAYLKDQKERSKR